MPSIQLLTASGQPLDPAAVAVLGFHGTSPGRAQSDRYVRTAPDAGGLVQVDPAAGEALTRVQLWVPPWQCLLDRSFSPGDWLPAELTISRAAPPRPPVQPEFRLRNRGPLQLRPAGQQQSPHIAGLASRAAPGAPVLPVEVHRYVVPPGYDVGDLTVTPDPAPVRVPAGSPLRQAPYVRDAPGRFGLWQRARPPLVRPAPVHPPELVRIAQSERHQWGHVVTIQVFPVQYDAQRAEYVHHVNLAYDLPVTPRLRPADAVAAPRSPGDLPVLFPGVSRDDVAVLGTIIRSPQVDLLPFGGTFWYFDPLSAVSNAPAPLLIVTDDTSWTGTSGDPPFLAWAPPQAGAPLGPNSSNLTVTGEFERLAYWKSSRGTPTKVVPISTIVDAYQRGDLREYLPDFALDLPEIIRGFLMYAAATWQTQFVLLGGDPSIVPMRQLLASRVFDFPPYPPQNADDNYALPVNVSGSPHQWVKLFSQTSQTGDLYDASRTIDTGLRLAANGSGTVYSYNGDGSGDSGWYFTSGQDFAGSGPYSPVSVDTGAPGYDPNQSLHIIVYGPAAAVDDQFSWIFDGRATHSDHYYADLGRVTDPAGLLHDYDANGNLLLAQVQVHDDPADDVATDGMKVTGDVFVGRAPVGSADDARTFVDKVIGYERYVRPDGTPCDPSYAQSVAFFADNWDHPWEFDQAAAPVGQATPDAGQFAWRGGDLLVHLQDPDPPQGYTGLATAMSEADVTATPPFSCQLLFDDAGTVTDIPYDQTGALSPSWSFCDSSYSRLPRKAGVKGSAFVLIHGPQSGFDLVFWQNPVEDDASVQKENTRAVIAAQLSQLGAGQRMYRDAPDLAGDVTEITESGALALAGGGPHLLSITGHGNVNNVSAFTTGQPQLPNIGRPSITYAHSCLTADPAATPCLGAERVLQPGGSLAWLGYARSCWTADVIADYEAGFWCGVAAFGRLGPPFSLHINSTGYQEFDQLFMQTLYGDPEMRVWTGPVAQLEVTVQRTPQHYWDWVDVYVTWSGSAVGGLDATMLQGWQGSLADPAYVQHTSTDDQGHATLFFGAPDDDAARIVISTPSGFTGLAFAPYVVDFPAGG